MGIDNVDDLKGGDDGQVSPDEAPTTHTPAPSGGPAEGTVLPADDNVENIADGDQIPESEEEITQAREPINPAEAEAEEQLEVDEEVEVEEE